MSPSAWVIITGHSRGMGKAMAAQCLARGTNVLGISRTACASLDRAAERSGATLEQWQCDLADGSAAADRLAAWVAGQDPASVTSLALINNAALLAPVQPLHEVPRPDLVMALRVGLEAPVLLTQAFLGASGAWGGNRRVLQISSGLGRSALGSLGSYCAVKAGLDNFSSSIALDQAQLGEHGAKIVSLAPGIIATDMQTQLRSADAVGFPDQHKFIGWHESGSLDSPEVAGRKVLAFLDRSDFGSQVIADVR